MKKIMTREQAQTSKDRAARFVLNVLRDSDGAQAIEDESLDDWAQRKKITFSNPRRNPRMKSLEIHNSEEIMAKKKTMAELLEENQSLKEENEQLQADLDDANDQLDQVADIVAADEDEDGQYDDSDEDNDENDDDQD